jgi:hypothetical protein
LSSRNSRVTSLAHFRNKLLSFALIGAEDRSSDGERTDDLIVVENCRRGSPDAFVDLAEALRVALFHDLAECLRAQQPGGPGVDPVGNRREIPVALLGWGESQQYARGSAEVQTHRLSRTELQPHGVAGVRALDAIDEVAVPARDQNGLIGPVADCSDDRKRYLVEPRAAHARRTGESKEARRKPITVRTVKFEQAGLAQQRNVAVHRRLRNVELAAKLRNRPVRSVGAEAKHHA